MDDDGEVGMLKCGCAYFAVNGRFVTAIPPLKCPEHKLYCTVDCAEAHYNKTCATTIKPDKYADYMLKRLKIANKSEN